MPNEPLDAIRLEIVPAYKGFHFGIFLVRLHSAFNFLAPPSLSQQVRPWRSFLFFMVGKRKMVRLIPREATLSGSGVSIARNTSGVQIKKKPLRPPPAASNRPCFHYSSNYWLAARANYSSNYSSTTPLTTGWL